MTAEDRVELAAPLPECIFAALQEAKKVVRNPSHPDAVKIVVLSDSGNGFRRRPEFRPEILRKPPPDSAPRGPPSPMRSRRPD